jgi:hypothetical protein
MAVGDSSRKIAPKLWDSLPGVLMLLYLLEFYHSYFRTTKNLLRDIFINLHEKNDMGIMNDILRRLVGSVVLEVLNLL